MMTRRQLCISLALADVVLFLVASAFNNHSSTSADGIVWWLAVFLFVALLVIGGYVMLQFLWTRIRRRGLSRRAKRAATR
jgi:cation transport ATPase